MKAAWIGVPELSSLSERSLGWHGWLWNVYFPHLPASKASWSHGRRQLWRKENGLWLSTFILFSFFSHFSFFVLLHVSPLNRYTHTYRHTDITHAHRHTFTHTHCTHNMHTHTYTCRHHTHGHKHHVHTHRYHTQTSCT